MKILTINGYYVLLLLKHIFFTKPIANSRKPHFFPSLGLSWAALGRSWAALGRSWAALGPLLGRSWAALGPLLGALGPLLAALGTTCKNHLKIDAKMVDLDPQSLPK